MVFLYPYRVVETRLLLIYPVRKFLRGSLPNRNRMFRRILSKVSVSTVHFLTGFTAKALLLPTLLFANTCSGINIMVFAFVEFSLPAGRQDYPA